MLQRKTRERITAVNQLFTTFGRMTVRQIYYQLVPTGINYRQINYALTKGRELGLIDPENIVDRSRPSYGLDTWSSPTEILKQVPHSYRLDYWADQPYRVELWTEKDALSQIIHEEAINYCVPVRVTRGFLSISNKNAWSNENLIILYFGDFDPSGLCIDMDLKNNDFLEYAEFSRIALTLDQIETYSLPWVPVKKEDPRADEYIELYGKKGWELDALNPIALRALVRESIEPYINFDLEQKQRQELDHQTQLARVARTFTEAA